MRIKSGHISVALLLIVSSGLGYVGWRMWRNAEDTAYLSCLASVMSSLNTQLSNNKIDISTYELPADEGWKVLSESQAEGLLRQSVAGDCVRTADVTRDLWNRKVNVALRQTEGHLKIVIWSNGSDSTSGTDDDLVYPYGLRFQDGKFRSIL